MLSNNPDEILSSIVNKWENVYWFARMLISSDKYGSVGKDNKLLLNLTSTLKLIKKENTESNDLLKLQKQAIKNLLETRFSKAKSILQRVQKFASDIDEMIRDEIDMNIFILTCENVMMPINEAILNIPNDDKEFTLTIAKSYLDIQGEKGLATVVNLWDDLGVRGCLTAERTEIVKAFAVIRVLLAGNPEIKVNDNDIVLTAFVQEFERRAAQKRKSRAGGSLEDVTSFILNYYNIKAVNAPDHFQADMEVDNWAKTKDGWLIGISCKRTLRERWKQVSSGDASMLSKYKIKYIYHIITYDEDLSDEKLTLLGGQRHIFFLPDNSRKLKYAREHIGLKDYVKPISQIINLLKSETGK